AFLRQTIKFFYADRMRLMVRDRATGQSRCLTEKYDRSVSSPKWFADNGRLYVEAEDSGFHGITLVPLKGEPMQVFEKDVTERSMDAAPTRQKRVSVFLRSSFNLPPKVYAHHVRENVTVPLENFNDDLVSSWQLGEVRNITFKGANEKDVQMFLVLP